MRRLALMLPLALLAACGETDTILPGTREPVGQAQVVQVAKARGLKLGAPKAQAEWPQRRGGATRSAGHGVLTGLTPAFAVSIGASSDRRHRITADPVVAGGRVFAMDSQAQVSAHSTAGAPLWTRSLVPLLETQGQGGASGLATADGVVYATSGYGELSALDAATGEVLWVQDLGAPGGAAPTVAGGLVYVVGADNTAWAVAREDGRIAWTSTGVPAAQSVAGGAGVAVDRGVAVVPFRGGELRGVFARGGVTRWSNVVSGGVSGRAVAAVADFTGDPVISGGRVYAGSLAGQLAAVDLTSGESLWHAPIAPRGPVLVAGRALFVMTDQGALTRVDAGSGAVVWRTALPAVEDGRRGRLIAHYGPVLASGRLLVVSSDGMVRSFDPATGAMTRTVELGGAAVSGPALAGGALYVVTSDGMLRAFR